MDTKLPKESQDEILEKFQQIDKHLLTLRGEINQLQALNKSLKGNFNLKLAEQLLNAAATLDKGEADYINQYTRQLTLGLEILGDFFYQLKGMQALNAAKRNRFASIVAHIMASQESIIKITGG